MTEEQFEETVPAVKHDDSFLSTIERLSMRPEIDVEKIKQIMEMQERVLDRNAEQAYNASMVQAQSRIKTIFKNRKNDQTNSRYADLMAILKDAAPIYTDEGFSLSFFEGDTTKENHIRVMCDIMHDQGHTKTRWVDVSIDTVGIKGSPNKTLIHGEGSSFMYGRRYLTCMIFNIPTGDDDDGNGAGGTEFISSEQAKELNAKILKIYPKDNGAQFLKWLGVETVDTIPVSKLKKANMAIKDAESKIKSAVQK